VRIFFGQEGRGFIRCGRPQFLVQKTSDFSKFMVSPYGQVGKEIEPVRTFFGEGVRGHYSRFSFMNFPHLNFIIEMHEFAHNHIF